MLPSEIKDWSSLQFLRIKSKLGAVINVSVKFAQGASLVPHALILLHSEQAAKLLR